MAPNTIMLDAIAKAINEQNYEDAVQMVEDYALTECSMIHEDEQEPPYDSRMDD